jgi:hypothetical protein
MPDLLGERGGTRTLDPMIKSHSTRVVISASGENAAMFRSFNCESV